MGRVGTVGALPKGGVGSRFGNEGQRKGGCRFSVRPLALLPFLCFALLARGPLFPCAFIAAVLHELGHVAAIYLCGGYVERFVLHPFGAEIVSGGRLMSYGQGLAVSLAGIVVNGLCALPLLWQGGPFLVHVFSACSLGLALFNLLPLKRLDGGEALKNFAGMLFSADGAGVFCKIFSLLGAVGLFFFLLFGIFFARLNPMLLLLFFYLLWGIL